MTAALSATPPAFAAPLPLPLSHASTRQLPRRAPIPRRRRPPASRRAAAPHVTTNPTASATPATNDAPGVENLVIIGSGPAGYTAALYAARANLKPVVLEGMSSGVPGGQLMTTAEVENFPGFADGITGPQLMANMRRQAARWGAELHAEDAVSLDLDTAPFAVTTPDRCLRAHAVVVATGATARRLAVPGEDKLWGRGISACAICDGAAPIFAAAPVAVVGGGDSACEEAVYLCKYAAHVHLLVRGDALTASKTLADRALRHPSVTVHYRASVVEAVAGEGDARGTSPLRAVRVRDGASGEMTDLDVRGLFYAIGHDPNTALLRGASRVRLSPSGYVITTDGPFTGQDGVFAAGDVADPVWRQAVTAAASGCTAALAAERYLTERGLGTEYRVEGAMDGEAKAAVESRESAAEREADARGNDDETTYDIEETWHSGQFALRKLYHESRRPLIVKYVSPGCGPCAQLKPMLHTVVRAYEGRVHYVEIDISKDVEVAESAGVTGSPTVQIFHEKSLVKEFRGVKMKSDYRRVVEDILTKGEVPVRRG